MILRTFIHIGFAIPTDMIMIHMYQMVYKNIGLEVSDSFSTLKFIYTRGHK